MREAFHHDLDAMTEDLVTMTRLTAAALQRATCALLDADRHLAESVVAGDEDIDHLRAVIDESAVQLLARQQPVAADLRRIVTAMHMATDLERMGDLASHVARVARRRFPEHVVPVELHDVIAQMAQVALHLAEKAGAAIEHRDLDAAESLAADDDAMDDLHRAVFRAVLAPGWCYGTEATVDVTLLSRYYERFGDHAVSVAERIVYLVTGRYEWDFTPL